jgi:hypothetical protein
LGQEYKSKTSEIISLEKSNLLSKLFKAYNDLKEDCKKTVKILSSFDKYLIEVFDDDNHFFQYFDSFPF